MAKTNKVDLSEVFQDGDVPTGQDFKNLISSSLNLNETGSTIQILSSSLIVSGALNVTGSISCSGNIEGDSFSIRGITFVDTNKFSTTESVIFGDSASIDQHRFTGSVFITGSEFDVNVIGPGSITFKGTSSFAGPINRFTGSLEVSGSQLELSGSLKISASANSYLSGGKLGIGTTTPEHTLEVTTVADKVDNGSNIIAKFHGDYAGNQGLMVSRSNGSSVKLLAGHSTYGGGLESSDALRFSTNGRNQNTCSLYIETDNKVALGTLVQGNYLLESPQATLHIKETPATSGTTNLLVLDGWRATDITADPRAIGLEFRGGDDNSYASGSIRLAYVHDDDYGYTGGNQESNGNLIFATTPDHTGITDKMILTGTGNLGIGTLAPTAKLAVVGDISSSGAIISASGQVTASKLMLTGNELNIGGGIFTSASLAGGGGGAVSSVTNGDDDRVATFGGTDTLNGESSLTFNGDGLKITGSFSPLSVRKYGTSGPSGGNTFMAEFRSGATLKTTISETGEIVTKSNIYHSSSLYGNKIRLRRSRGAGSTNLTNPEIIFSNNHSDSYDSHHPTSTNTHFRDGESYSFGLENDKGGIKLASLGGGIFIDPEGNADSMDYYLKSFKLMEWTDQAPPSEDGVYDIYDLGTSGYWYGRGVLYARNGHTAGTEVSRASKCIDFGHNKSNTDSQDTTGVRVGIAGEGEHTGTNKLWVHGTIRSTQETNNVSSDRRFKENIKDLEPQLDIIKKLKPRRFDWKKDSPNYEDRFDKVKNQPGFIAQEVEDLIPNMVIKDQTPEGYMTLNSSDLIPMLIKATQEQQEIIESLTKRIEDLENK